MGLLSHHWDCTE